MTKSIYMTEKTDDFIKDLIKGSADKSASSVISAAVRDAAVQNYLKIRITPGAYVCLSEQNTELLRFAKIENDVTLICTVADEAFSRYADKCEALNQYTM